MVADRVNREHLTCALTGAELRTELFAPNSILYRILGDASTAYAGLAVFVLGTLQIQAITALKDHEPLFNGSIDSKDYKAKNKAGARRQRESYELVTGIVLAPTEQDKADAAFAMRELHRKVRGKLDSGERYHAWEPKVWARAWTGIFIGMVESYGYFKGYANEEEKEKAIVSFIELGKTFGVKGIPENMADFYDYWHSFYQDGVVDNTIHAIATPAVNGFYTKKMSNLIRKGKWSTALSFSISGLIAYRFSHIGALVTFPIPIQEQLGIYQTPWDTIELKLHKLAWRLLPSRLTLVGPGVFKKNLEKGFMPVWRSRFSRENLALVKNELSQERGLINASD